MNRTKTLLFLTGLTVLFILIGSILGGRVGMSIALFFAAIMNFGAYWFSEKIVLKMYRASQIDPYSNYKLHHNVRNLATRADFPVPNVYVIPKSIAHVFIANSLTAKRRPSLF
jgi:heat shock protein HtpX